MPPVVLLALLTVALSAATLVWLATAPQAAVRREVLDNARHGLVADPDPAAGPGRPGTLARLARLLATSGTVARLDRLAAGAGRPPTWTVERLLVAKLLLPVAVAGVGVLFLAGSPSAGRILLVAVVVVVGHFVPDLLLQSRGQERQQRIGLELPDTLDQMTIAVEAGLGFEAAMLRAAQNGTGPLTQELVRTLQDMQLGQSRREAYQALCDRTSAPDLRRFVRAVIQADLYGIGIADVLRTQAGEMRLKRRQRAEEKAMKIPVKVIFPLMLCILPALFIVLLGPIVIQVTQVFGH
ncbi:type II secretion system F family protein [Nakamurella endophytica]|uniref:Type II secretion system protein GspF domain-containing protein n=1 Tax=Nakamurella endophytica TaxID=1748367 RepID=A0A917WC46_9ACTN|nr:type II secretion system F family protein [Nakamurella endophytica]GGL88916.1 hypothetical protein GCM10011594_05750 [Nakamurella endophytica]